MSDCISYNDVLKIIASNGGSIVVNPLANWGRLPIWKAAKRAQKHGIVSIRREGPSRAIIKAAEGLRQ